MGVFAIVVGIVGIAAGVAQYLSAVDRLDLRGWPWPFVPRTESRTWQFGFAALMCLVGITALVVGLA